MAKPKYHMKVGDRIRIVKKTALHAVDDIGEIIEIDWYHQHALIVQFPNETSQSLILIPGHCASLLVDVPCDWFEIIKAH